MPPRSYVIAQEPHTVIGECTDPWTTLKATAAVARTLKVLVSFSLVRVGRLLSKRRIRGLSPAAFYGVLPTSYCSVVSARYTPDPTPV